jgi:hypothetical protein
MKQGDYFLTKLYTEAEEAQRMERKWKFLVTIGSTKPLIILKPKKNSQN